MAIKTMLRVRLSKLNKSKLPLHTVVFLRTSMLATLQVAMKESTIVVLKANHLW